MDFIQFMPAASDNPRIVKYRRMLTELERSATAVKLPASVEERLLSYQVLHTKLLSLLLPKRGIAADLSDTGSGKSYSMGAVAETLGLRPFIVTPKGAVAELHRVVTSFNLSPLGIVNYETLKNGKYYATIDDFRADVRSPCPYIEVVRETLRDHCTGEPLTNARGEPKQVVKSFRWKLPSDTLIVFDEAQRGKNGVASSGGGTVTSLLLTSVRAAISLPQRIFCLLASATMSDKLENFAALCYLLGFYQPYTTKNFQQYLKTLGAKDEKEQIRKLHTRILPWYGSRMTIAAIKRATGDTLYKANDVQACLYEVTTEVALSIEAQHKEIVAAMRDLRAQQGSNALARITRCWQQIELLKVPTAAQEVFGELRDGRHVVVFVNFSDTRYRLVDELLASGENRGEDGEPLVTESQIAMICGKQSAAERDMIVSDWAADRYSVLVCQIRAGGTALSLHDVQGRFPRTSIMFPSLSAIDTQQTFGRIYRSRARSDARQRIIFCRAAGTIAAAPAELPPLDDSGSLYQWLEGVDDSLSIEELICKAVNRKLANIAIMNDGSADGAQQI